MEIRIKPSCRIALCLILYIVCFFAASPDASAATINKPTNNLGMVGYWTFDGKDMTPNVRDKSGSGYHGTLNGQSATTTAVGKIGQALQTDGTDDSVTMGDVDIGQGVGSLTYSMWFKPSAGQSTSDRPLIGHSAQAGVNSTNMYIARSNGAATMQFSVCNTSDSCAVGAGNSAFNSTEWVYAVGVYDGANVKLYVNGVLQSTQGALAGTIKNNGGIFGIAYVSPNDTAKYSGLVDDVRVYNRALTASEITALYNKGASKIGKGNAAVTNGLVGHWTFDGKDMRPNVRDISGQNNHGTLSGQAATTTSIGKIGQALFFDGADDRINAGSEFIGANAASISVWVKANTSGDVRYIVSNDKFSVYVNSSSNKFFSLTSDNGATNAHCADNSLVVDEWVHLVMTRNSSGVTNCYVNGSASGAADQSSGTPTAVGTTNVYIGGKSAGTTVFSGTMDDFRLYNRVITSAEVVQLYNLGAGSKAGTSNNGANSSSLVGRWTFDGKDMRPNVRDISGQGNHGTLNGQAATTTSIGRIGQALQFDGVDDFITMGDVGVLDGLSAFSVGGWVKASSENTGNIQIIRKQDSASTANGWQLYRAGTAETFRFEVGTGVSAVAAETDVGYQDTQWHHVMGVYNGSNVQVYVDGVASDPTPPSQTGVVVNISTPLCIGRTSGGGSCNGGLFWSGLMDDIRMYDKALSAAEVLQLYNSGR